MAREAKRRFKVTFPSDEVSVEVAEGTTLLDACRLAEIAIDAVCGGEGKCGRCKMKPKGSFKATPSSFITEAEASEGIVLGCQCYVHGDLTVEILPRSRIGRHQILTKSVAEIPHPIQPWVYKRFVELPPATINDNIADLERLTRGLGTMGLCAPLETLNELSGALRASGWKVTATISKIEPVNEVTRVEPLDRAGTLLGIAVDIGTTTVVVDLVDLHFGSVIATASDYNRQTSRGEDVIARMMYGEEKGGDELRVLARDTINELISRVLRSATIKLGKRPSAGDVVAASIAGNTIMTHFFLGLDTRRIRLEPYVPVAYHMPCLKGREVDLGINPRARAFIFPSRAGYVGGDVIADVLASGMHRSNDLTLLIDVGTNGEIVLGGKDWLASCSCSAGPAFEGGEVSCGMRAMEGAIDKIRINDDLTSSYHVIGGASPVGICGSGLIDLVAEMYASGIIDRKARIQESGSKRTRASESGLEYVIETKGRLGKGASADLVVTDADLQNLLRTKAAVFAACSTLLKKTDESLDGMAGVVIAGGFGFHIDIARAISIGMFPDLPQEKYRFIGNGSLGGARLALISAKRRREVEDIFEKMTYFELSVDNDFYNEFSSSLFIPHTDLSRFPSVARNRAGRRGAR